MVEFSETYGVTISQLTPNSWIFLTCFILIYEQADINPDLNLLQYLFIFSKKSQYWHLSGRANRALFSGSPKVRNSWFKSFLVISNPHGWGNLPRLWVDDTFKGNRKIELTDDEEKKLEILQTRAEGECFNCGHIISRLKGL